MKKIAVFCIPAHGHTNPMLPVVRELAARGDEVRFYSFSEFQEKIEQTGAAFVGCDRFLPELTVRNFGAALLDDLTYGRMGQFVRGLLEEKPGNEETAA